MASATTSSIPSSASRSTRSASRSNRGRPAGRPAGRGGRASSNGRGVGAGLRCITGDDPDGCRRIARYTGWGRRFSSSREGRSYCGAAAAEYVVNGPGVAARRYVPWAVAWVAPVGSIVVLALLCLLSRFLLLLVLVLVLPLAVVVLVV